MIRLNSPSSRLLFTTVRLEAYAKDGTQSVGTAFYFHYAAEGGHVAPVLITNKHVVKGAVTGRFLLHERSGDSEPPTPGASSFTVTLDGFADRWVGHPGDVDLCAMPFEPLRREAQSQAKPIFYHHLDETLLPTESDLAELATLEEVVMVGYPIGLWDEAHNLPVLRRGSTASHPAMPYCGKPMGLVDIACFLGSSGSPVLLFNEGWFRQGNGMAAGVRLKLLGVLFAVPVLKADGTIQTVEIPTASSAVVRPQFVHLGSYIRAEELLVLKRQLFSQFGMAGA